MGNFIFSWRKRPVLVCLSWALMVGLGCSSGPDKKIPEELDWILIHLIRGVGMGQDEQFRREQEWPFNHQNQENAPKVCLALSGGGIRSAAFSIGILKGLQQKGDLQKVDVISAVSGGGYAVGWMYALLHSNPDMSLAQVFEEKQIHQLTQKSRFIGEKISDIVLEVPLVPFNVLQESLRNVDVSKDMPDIYTDEISGLGRIYADAIADTFLERNKKIRLADLVSTIRQKNLPFFVLNAGVISEKSGTINDLILGPNFELTPLRQYGVTVGELADQEELKKNFFLWSLFSDDRRDVAYLHDAMSISGAAIDMHGKDAGWSNSYNFIGIALGRRFTLKYLENDGQYRYVYLADGGFSDNLGVVPLFRRRCSQILAVDAEYDPNYNFGAYVKLKRTLKNDFNSILRVPGLDGTEGLLKSSLIEAEKTGELCEGMGCRRIGMGFDGANPVFPQGTISVKGWRYMDANVTPPKTYEWPDSSLNLTYAKLSINGEIVSANHNHTPSNEILALYPETLAKYISQNKDPNCSKKADVACQAPFPQEDTINQIYSPEQMGALIDLGATFVERYLGDWPASTN